MRLYFLSIICFSLFIAPALAADPLSMIEPAQDEVKASAQPDFPEVVNDISRSFVMPLASAPKAEVPRPVPVDQTTEEISREKTTPAKVEQQVPDEETTDILNAGDTIRISVRDDKDVSGTYNISKQGTITLALIGEVKAAGKSLDALKKELTEKLADGFFVNPQVSVKIETYRPFSINGDVKNPGDFAYVEGMTILNAITTGGGYTKGKDTDNMPVRLQRETSKGLFRYHSVPLSTKIRPGDVIVIGAEAP